MSDSVSLSLYLDEKIGEPRAFICQLSAVVHVEPGKDRNRGNLHLVRWPLRTKPACKRKRRPSVNRPRGTANEDHLSYVLILPILTERHPRLGLPDRPDSNVERKATCECKAKIRHREVQILV